MTPNILDEVARALCRASEEVCGLEPNTCRKACEGCKFEARAAAKVLLKYIREMAMEGPLLDTSDIDGLAREIGIEMDSE